MTSSARPPLGPPPRTTAARRRPPADPPWTSPGRRSLRRAVAASERRPRQGRRRRHHHPRSLREPRQLHHGRGRALPPRLLPQLRRPLGVALLLVSCAWTWFSAVMMLKAADVISARHLRGAPIASYEELMPTSPSARAARRRAPPGFSSSRWRASSATPTSSADVVSPFAVDVLPRAWSPAARRSSRRSLWAGCSPWACWSGATAARCPSRPSVPYTAHRRRRSLRPCHGGARGGPAHYGGSAAAQVSGFHHPDDHCRGWIGAADRVGEFAGADVDARRRAPLSARTPPSFPWCGP